MVCCTYYIKVITTTFTTSNFPGGQYLEKIKIFADTPIFSTLYLINAVSYMSQVLMCNTFVVVVLKCMKNVSDMYTEFFFFPFKNWKKLNYVNFQHMIDKVCQGEPK